MPRAARLPAALVALLLAVPAGAGDPAQTQVTPIDAAQFRAVLAEQRGQVVLVNFWATWCRPCLKELPQLTVLAEKYRGDGLRLVAVSLDEPTDMRGVVFPFLVKWFPGFRSYGRVTPDMDGIVSVVDPAWNEVLPTSYVIDRKGAVRATLQGGKSAAEFEAAVVPLLNER